MSLTNWLICSPPPWQDDFRDIQTFSNRRRERGGHKMEGEKSSSDSEWDNRNKKSQDRRRDRWRQRKEKAGQLVMHELSGHYWSSLTAIRFMRFWLCCSWSCWEERGRSRSFHYNCSNPTFTHLQTNKHQHIWAKTQLKPIWKCDYKYTVYIQ